MRRRLIDHQYVTVLVPRQTVDRIVLFADSEFSNCCSAIRFLLDRGLNAGVCNVRYWPGTADGSSLL